MTANHEHTPTDEEMQELFETGAMVTEFAHNRTDATIAWQLWLQERDARISAAAEQRGAEAALLCVDEPSWEHHDQTDGFPCTNCLNKAQKGIDRYRADRITNKEGDNA